MKKIVALFMVLLPFMASAHVSLGEVSIGGEKYDVYVIFNKNKPKYYGFYCPSREVGKQEIWIKADKINKFRTAMYEAKVKYVEWSRVAEDNNVGEYDKEIPVKFPNVTYVWGAGDSFFSDSQFKLRFHRAEGLNFAMLVTRVVSDTNRFIDARFSFSLLCEEEFDTFLKVFSSANIEKVLSENANFDTETGKRTVDDSLFH